ncbi:hypothetical protein JAAARDRAFT_198894 [Jaapia argillacea MUCL 33604]|uniref:Uncharacterized protein n=1 Tax=Jaapia argillacea MUCL 33604 TaxID=933084 RepID=A0A067PMR5_9AGAM|nr:hypothetical protein JAAARDRAFT_198894 [Jaapia argillacea MUCL 33604]
MWRAFFYRLERRHDLDVKNRTHLWLLHHLFLDAINEDCETFDRSGTPIPSLERDMINPKCSSFLKSFLNNITHLSLKDMRFMGRLQHGEYTDNCDGIHPDIIEEYYGTEGCQVHRHQGQTGAGHPSDESEGEEEGSSSDNGDEGVSASDGEEVEINVEELSARIAQDHESYFHHAPVKVPKHANSFNSEELKNVFKETLTDVCQAGHIPQGFGVDPREWDEEGYPAFEVIQSGRRGTKELWVSLPDFLWHPRAVLWAQALDVLTCLLSMAEMDSNMEMDGESDSGSGSESSSSE